MTTHAADQLRRLQWGAIATLVVAASAAAIWGRAGAIGAAASGGVATALQLIAARAMERTGIPAALDHLAVYGMGVVLRMSGVLLLGMAIGLDRTAFPPVPSAVGYLGTILPLLYLETRLGR
jgi:hypothetical protein